MTVNSYGEKNMRLESVFSRTEKLDPGFIVARFAAQAYNISMISPCTCTYERFLTSIKIKNIEGTTKNVLILSGAWNAEIGWTMSW